MEKKEIAFNQVQYERQLGYNKSYCQEVNSVLAGLRGIVPDINDNDIITFLSQPSALISRLRADAEKEYNGYVASLPTSVKNTLAFTFPMADKIEDIHRKLPQPKSYFFRENTCRIVNGECVCDTEELHRRCAVYGDEALNSLWQRVNALAKELNDLGQDIKQFSQSMSLIEDPMHLSAGIVRINENGNYEADIDRLKQLA